MTRDGVVPDIIINPHAIPSRMTVGQLIESVMAKVGCVKGFEGDGTPFTRTDVGSLCRLLGTPVEEGGCGFAEAVDETGPQGFGNEILYNGKTGQMLECSVFIGPCYYLRSKHMVQDKMHSRATGILQVLTGQPPEGRARGGSSRVGEMERDCLIAHGAASWLKEKFIELSDGFIVNIDRATGLLAIGSPQNGTLRDSQVDVKQVALGFSMKLLTLELMSIGIAMRYVLG